MTSVRVVRSRLGDARLHVDRAHRPVATLVLGHGAGRGIDAPDLVALAAALPRQGITVFRVEQPWAVAGRRVAPAPAALDEATVDCVNAIRVRTPTVLGGRSAGARVACRLADSLGAVGCLALAFPLHPPGRPERSRARELAAVRVPTLVVQGERDPFGGPAEFPEDVDLTVIPEATHTFAVPKRAALDRQQTLGLIVEAVVEWVTLRVA